MPESKLIYQTSPKVTIATNSFVNVPVIVQFDDSPLISVVREQQLGYTSEIQIHHSDGTHLAKVRGTRIFATETGKKAGLVLRDLQGMTVCELNRRTVFEIHHESGDAFRLHAELHAPNGFFLKVHDAPVEMLDVKGDALKVRGAIVKGCEFKNMAIGIWLKRDGVCTIGVRANQPADVGRPAA